MARLRDRRNNGPSTLAINGGPPPDALAAAFQHAMIGIAIAGPDGQLRDANPALLHILGYARDELATLRIADITHPNDQPGDAVHWARLAAGEVDTYQREKRYVRRDGTILWGLVTVSALRDENGIFLGSSAQIQDITAQKQAEAALRESEAQLEALLSRLPVALYSQPWGGQHAIRYVSPQFTELTGLAADDLPTNERDHLARVHPDDRERVRAIDAWANQTGETARTEYRFLGGHGAYVWIDHQSVLMRDERGHPLAWHGSMVDISERKRLEASLQASDARFRRAFEDSAIGMALGTPDDVCIDANDAYCRMVGLPREALIGHSFKNVTYPQDRGAQDQRLERLIAGETDAFVVEKRYVRPDGEVVNALATISAVRDDEGALLYCVGQIVDVTAQKAAEAALSDSEELLRSVIEEAPAAVYLMEAGTNGRFTYASPKFGELTGLSLEAGDCRLQDFFARVHPDDIARVLATDAASRTGAPFDIEYRIRSRDGAWTWVHDRSTPTRDAQGRIIAWHGILLDITERRRLQAELQEKDARLQSLIDHLPVALYSVDPAPGTHYTYTSPQFGRLTGMTPEDIARGEAALDARIHPDDQEIATAGNDGDGTPDAVWESEYRVLSADGEWRWVHDRAMLARDEEGNPLAWHGALLDVSEQKALQAALFENEERLRLLVEQLPVALFSLKPGSRSEYAYVSPQFGALTGMSPEEVARGTEALFARMHPEDVERVRAADHQSYHSGESHEVEYRVRRGDGEWVWLQERAMLAHDTLGQPVAWHGVLLDITPQRQTEAALAASAQHGEALIASALDALIEIDHAGRVIEFNPAAERTFGYTRAEVIGQPIADLIIPPELREAHREGIQRYLATGQPAMIGRRLELPAQRADGATFTAELTVTPLPGGDQPRFVGFVRDISDRLAMETALRESEALFRSTFEGAAVGMALCDPDCRVRFVNPALERLLGFDPGELDGQDSDLLTHPDDLERHRALRQKLLVGEIDGYQLEKRYARKDGQYVWVILNVTGVRDERGELRSVIGQLQDITARKAAEEALRQSEERFRSAFEGAGIGMSLARMDGRFFDANPAFCKFLGYTRDEILQLTYLDITHPDDREFSLDYTRRLFSQELPSFSTEKRYVRKDGAVVWGDLTITTVGDSSGTPIYEVAQVQDITARKEAEAALRVSEARFRALVQNDPDVIVIVDEARNVTYISPSAYPAFGGSDQEPEANIAAYLDRVHPEDLERTLALGAEIQDQPGGITSTELRIRHATYGWRWFQVTLVNLLHDPGVRGYLVKLRDITEQKQAEIATADALHAQQTAIAELERLNRSKSRFLSTISHEFRTPLTAIIGYSEFLANNAADPTMIREDAEVIHREANRLNRLVDDILLLDRVDARRVTLTIAPVDLNRVMLDVLETFRPLMENHPPVLELDPHLRVIEGDHDRLAQAMTNLISNAIKYSPDGGAVTIVTRNTDDGVLISVQDEGIGIPQEDAERIFDRFERIESGIAGRIAGTGLGLSIVQEIAHLHGGRAWVESQPGFGSTFFLELPMRVMGDG